MDGREIFAMTDLQSGTSVNLSGWLADTNDGLYILGDHYPEDYNYPYRVRIDNGNIIYPILEKIPSLGGGWSLIFYKVKVDGVLVSSSPWGVRAKKLDIEVDRGSGRFTNIDISSQIIAAYVKKNGDFKFDWRRNPLRVWLDD